MIYVVIGTWAFMIVNTLLNSPSTTIVLGENNKATNSIVIQKNDKQTIINKPRQFVNLYSKSNKIKIGEMSEKEIQSKFKNIIDNQPKKPTSILLYFEKKASTLTKKSKEKLNEIINEIKNRKYSNITIIGHTDTVGSEEINIKLAKKRAIAIKKWLLSKNLIYNSLDVQSYGESDLLIKTDDNISEERNRRVEVLIK